MKKIFRHTLTIILALFAILALSPIETTEASVVYAEYHPQDLIGNDTIYDEEATLIVEGNESELLPQVDFSKLPQLMEIRLNKTTILDDDIIIDLDAPISGLAVVDSVVNLSAFDLDDYENIEIRSTYMVGEKIDNPKIRYTAVLNEEYKLELNDLYGIQGYEEQIDDIAREIKAQSDGTASDLIRLTTLYVIEHMEYDYDGEAAGDSIFGAIFDKGKGVCVNYANFESRLLNKVGVFAMSVGGCADLTDCMNAAHEWVLVYANNDWYYIDPTWIDDTDSIEALKEKDFQGSADLAGWYMIPANDTFTNYASQRRVDFSMHNSIPVEERVSKLLVSDIDIPSTSMPAELPNTGTNSNIFFAIGAGAAATLLGYLTIFWISSTKKQ